MYFEQLGSVLLAGDWNARVGKKTDYIDCDANVSNIDDYEYLTDNPLGRASQDSVCNPRGIKMLDLCKSLSLRIANGRLGHDFNKGELTYFSQHSQSIIDYLALKEFEFSLIRDYCIGDFNSHSDLAVLYFANFGCSVVNSNSSDDQSQNTFYKWNCDKKDMFRRGLIGKLPTFNTIVNDVNTNTKLHLMT